MNATQAKRKLEAIARMHGAFLEEDEKFRGDMRTFQLCAPYGKVWDEGTKCLLVRICSTRDESSFKYNKGEVQFASTIAAPGVRAMTKEEALCCDEEIS